MADIPGGLASPDGGRVFGIVGESRREGLWESRGESLGESSGEPGRVCGNVGESPGGPQMAKPPGALCRKLGWRPFIGGSFTPNWSFTVCYYPFFCPP